MERLAAILMVLITGILVVTNSLSLTMSLLLVLGLGISCCFFGWLISHVLRSLADLIKSCPKALRSRRTRILVIRWLTPLI